MGKKGKKAQAGKPKKLTPKDVGKRLGVLAKKLEEETKGADLFAPLPPTEDCAICLVPLSRLNSEVFYGACCGNDICDKQNEEKSAGKKLAFTCPFCREPNPNSDEEILCRLQARCLQNDHIALGLMGEVYRVGQFGTAKDHLKALHYLIQAVELGSPDACTRIGTSYALGKGVSVDREKSTLFRRAGALRGDVLGRNNIGCAEYFDLGNHEIGIRHWKIAAEAGLQDSLNNLRDIFNNVDGNMPGKEFIGKEEMDTIYRSGHDAQMEIKTEEREKHQPFFELRRRILNFTG